LRKLPDRPIGVQADEDADFFNPFQAAVNLVKPTDVKISHQAIKRLGRFQQRRETLPQCFTVLVGDKRNIRRHATAFTPARPRGQLCKPRLQN
jgi:hypothetical protein